MGLKQGKIYNLCKKPITDELFIEEYDGWLDVENRVGYYKLPSDRWAMTNLDTGCKYGNNNWPTRREAIQIFENGKWYIENFKKNKVQEFIKKKAMFQETLTKYLNHPMEV